MRLAEHTRMIQTKKNITNETYTLQNPFLNKEIEINETGASILRKINKGSKLFIDKIFRRKAITAFVQNVESYGFIMEDKQKINNHNVFLAEKCDVDLPLSILNIELVNNCNLNCQYCYGDFFHQNKYLDKDKLFDLLPELNKLHTHKIALTGGECTLHPNICEIAEFFLENGFELCIISNGYNFETFRNLLETCAKYHFTIKISLDGTEDIHNKIRRNTHAFERTKATLDLISTYSNVDLYISTVVMKDNIDSLTELNEFIKSNYENAVHSKDLVFPQGNANDSQFTFSPDEFDLVYKTCPEIFSNPYTSDKRKFRCLGGINQCTLCYDGTLKICNAACADVFKFKHNVFNTSLSYAWINCGNDVNFFRNERLHSTNDCLKCDFKNDCYKTDCRILAYAYTGDVNKSNPITCYSTQHNKKLKEDICN